MASKINDLTSSATAGGSPAAVARTRGPSGSTNLAPSGGPGEVHITDTATHLAALEQALRDTPAVDQVRVAELRAAIEKGQYTIRPMHVAERFLHIEHALAGLTQESITAGTTAVSGEGR